MSSFEKLARPTTVAYITGFVFSVILTIEAYLLAKNHTLSQGALVFVLIALAVTQLMVQLYFFLHLGEGRSARWNVIVFFFAAVVVTILVVGSLWIMSNLTYHHAHEHGSPEQTNTYIIQDEGIKE